MRTYENVLLVAPDIDIDEQREQVQDVVNALKPTTLLGKVTRFDLTRALSGGKFDIVWITCHATPEGIALSDGVIDGNSLAQFLRQHPPKLIYLNTCASDKVALDLYDTLHVPLICTVEAVEVMKAYYTGASLARYLSQGMSVSSAFEMSRPGHDGTYRLIGWSRENEGSDRIDALLEKVGKIYQVSRRNEERIDRLEKKMDDLSSANSKFESYIRRTGPSPLRFYLWSAGYLGATLILIVAMYEVRHAFGLTTLGSAITILFLAFIVYAPLTCAVRLEPWEFLRKEM